MYTFENNVSGIARDARSGPIRFKEAPVVRKPGKRACEEDKRLYREQKKKDTLSTRGG